MDLEGSGCCLMFGLIIICLVEERKTTSILKILGDREIVRIPAAIRTEHTSPKRYKRYHLGQPARLLLRHAIDDRIFQSRTSTFSKIRLWPKHNVPKSLFPLLWCPVLSLLHEIHITTLTIKQYFNWPESG
jgi:hypothetical protein